MPLKLHPDCRLRLAEKIAEFLPEVEVKHKTFLHRRSAAFLYLADKILPQSGDVKEQLLRYIGESPVYNFMTDKLSQDLLDTQQYDSDNPKLLLEQVKGFEDAKAVADRLVSEFESLPWRYSIAIKLENDFGRQFAQSGKELSVCDWLRLRVADANFLKEFPVKSNTETAFPGLAVSLGLFRDFRSRGDQNWEQSAAYLQMDVDGFIGPYGETAPLERAVSMFKCFCGIAIAIRLVEVKYDDQSPSAGANIFIHRRVGNAWRFERLHTLEGAFSAAFYNLVPYDDGRPMTEDLRQRVVANDFASISHVFRHTDRSQKIMLACEWLFDSYCGTNELMSFVHAVVTMEILLGDKKGSDIVGLGELLRNRCAYLIGTSQKQREEYLEDFKLIYDVRCDIVHRGKIRLTGDERALLSKLRWMCGRVIEEEIKLLKRDLEKESSASASLRRAAGKKR